MFNNEIYEKFNNTQKSEFSRIVNKLFSVCFINKCREKKDYYFIETYFKLFEQFFHLAGWELDINRDYGVIHIYNLNDSNRYNFKMYETIILLILRILYYQKEKEIRLNTDIIITSEEIHTLFDTLKLRDKPIEKGVLKDSISIFKKFNLIDVIDSDVTDASCRIKLLPALLFAVKIADINDIYKKIETYSNTKEEDTIEETDEN